ncbi:MAG: hypothetical protein ABI611_13530 [Solirubrobacteraceae bacterium]
MVPRRDRLVLWLFALVVAAWMVAEALTGDRFGLLYLAPALVLALPLLLGRYVGEDQLVDLGGRAAARPQRRRAPRVAGPRRCARVMQRGGRLVASGMAKRPPPALAPARSAA